MVVPVGGPYPVDAEPKSTLVVPAGSYFWLKSRLFQGTINPIPPDAAAFTRILFAVIRDPDGNILAWATSALDTTDSLDTKQASSPDYVGNLSVRVITDGAITSGSATLTSATAAFNTNDAGKSAVGTGIPANTTISAIVSATQVTLSQNATATASGVTVALGTANTGLFAEGYPGSVTGRFAIKALCPSLAEQTVLNNSRRYSVTWGIMKNDTMVVDIEYFDVGPSAGIGFGDGVTISAIRLEYTTPFDDPILNGFIVKAGRNVKVLLQKFEADIPRTFGDDLQDAILQEAIRLILVREISTSRAAHSIAQGGMAIALPDAMARNEGIYKVARDSALLAYLNSEGIHVNLPPGKLEFVRSPSADVMRKSSAFDQSTQITGGPPI